MGFWNWWSKQTTSPTLQDFSHVYAIVKVDLFDKINDNNMDFATHITIVEIVMSLEEAESEVARLNDLNKDKMTFCFWQTTGVKSGE